MNKLFYEPILIYTIILNNYDDIPTPPPTSPANFKYLILTDDPNLHVDGWETRLIEKGGVRWSRYYKINSHLVDENYKNTIFIDGCLRLKPHWWRAFDQIDTDEYPIWQFPHRDNFENHLNILIRTNKDNPSELKIQADRYYEDGFPKDSPVTENCMIIRVNNEEVEEYNLDWWDEYSISSCRDQLSSAYIRWKSPVKIGILNLNARDNQIYSGWCEHRKNIRKKLINRSDNVAVMGKRFNSIVNDKTVIKKEPDSESIELKDISNLKVLVATINIKSDSMSEKATKMYDDCIGSIKDFSDKYKYDYLEITEKDEKYPHPSWCRFDLLQMKDQYDFILYIDGDIFIKPGAENPIKYYNDPHSIYALDSAETYPYMKGSANLRLQQYRKEILRLKSELINEIPKSMTSSRYINAGVLIIPNDSLDIFTPPVDYINDLFYLEQTLLNIRIQTMGMNFSAIKHKWNAGHIDLNKNWDYSMSDDVHFVHFNVAPGKNKAEYFEKWMSNWKNK